MEGIEKLSCRSGWFVEPVRALIHPTSSPHKKNIKQAMEERRRRWGRWGETERQTEAERDSGHRRCVNSNEQGLKMEIKKLIEKSRRKRIGNIWYIRPIEENNNCCTSASA